MTEGEKALTVMPDRLRQMKILVIPVALIFSAVVYFGFESPMVLAFVVFFSIVLLIWDLCRMMQRILDSETLQEELKTLDRVKSVNDFINGGFKHQVKRMLVVIALTAIGVYFIY